MCQYNGKLAQMIINLCTYCVNGPNLAIKIDANDPKLFIYLFFITIIFLGANGSFSFLL